MRLALLLLLLLLASACTSSSLVVMRRFEGRSLRACIPAVGWWEEDLAEECGEPDVRVPRAGKPQECLIYASMGARRAERVIGLESAWRTSALNAPPFVAVCLEESRLSKRRDRKVAEVLELAALPLAFTSTAAR